MKMSGIELPGFIFGFRYWTIQLTSWTASWLSRRWRCPGSPTPSWWKLCSSDHLWNNLSFRMTLKYCFFLSPPLFALDLPKNLPEFILNAGDEDQEDFCWRSLSHNKSRGHQGLFWTVQQGRLRRKSIAASFLIIIFVNLFIIRWRSRC